MHLLLILLGWVSAWAGPTQYILRLETPVYAVPEPGANVQFYLHKGEPITTTPTKTPDFVEVRVKRNGRQRRGYVKQVDLDESQNVPKVVRDWGLGGGFQYASLTQKGRTFDTDDQVQYSTTEYKSTSGSVLLTGQWKTVDFWRLSLALKQTHFTGSATNNVTHTQQAIELKQTFLSFYVQRAWMPLDWKWLYIGAGLEVARAVAQSLNFAGQSLSTNDTPLPTYIGAVGSAGFACPIIETLSLYGEGSYELVVNQSPSISEVQGSLGIIYWSDW